MKILLLLSPGENYRVSAQAGKPHAGYAPMTLLQLAALIPEELHAEVDIADLGVLPLPDISPYDLLGISVITCGAPFAYQLSLNARAQGKTVILGGSHVTLMKEEALQFADAVVAGYAELSWPQLLRDWKAGCMKRIYEDTTFEYPDRLPDLNRKLLKKHRYFFNNCLEATRGCPNSCQFCTLGPFTCNKTFTRPIDDVIREISTMGRSVMFLDSSPTEFTSYTERLWKAMEDLHLSWFSAATLRFARDERQIRLAAKSGCKGVLIGFESFNRESLKEADKSFNHPAEYRDMVKRLHDYGIKVLGCFVFGFDADTRDVFRSTADMVNEIKIDIVRYSILTPFPGTGLFEKMKQKRRLLHTDWSRYDTYHTVFQPAQMSPHELEAGLALAYRETYTAGAIFKRLAHKATVPISLAANLQFRRLGKETREFSERILKDRIPAITGTD